MPDASAALPLTGIVNFRDVGGHTTHDGRTVRSGVLFRSGQLDQGGDHEVLAAIGLRTVFDLRGEDEVDMAPDLVPDGVQVVHLDVLADSRERIATHLAELTTRPDLVEATLRSGAVEAHYRTTYRNLVLLDSARRAYAELFSRLAQHEGPALFHCTAGKDRTGWAAAALLGLLGVPDDVVMADYLRSSEPVLASFHEVLERFEAAGGDPSALVPVFAVTPAYLGAAHEAVAEQFGDLEGWFRDGLGLGPEVPEQLRSRLLV